MMREPEPKLSEDTAAWVREKMAFVETQLAAHSLEMKPLFVDEFYSKKKWARDKADPEALGKDRRGR